MKLVRKSPQREPDVCAWVEEHAPLYCYGELPDAEAHRLEAHLEVCAACRDEVTAVRTVMAMLDTTPAVEPSASMLTASRIRLEEALDQVPAPHKSRFAIAIDAWRFHIAAVPALATLLVVVGIGTGGAAGYGFAHHAAVRENTAAQAQNKLPSGLPEHIANVSSISQQPGTGLVEVSYNKLVPDSTEGLPDDPKIQQLLLLASQSQTNPGVRVDSVGLLAEQCHTGSVCEQTSVRDALRAALKYDKNPAVRLKALEGLQPFVAQDTAVRDSVLEALLHDDNPGVRAEAIQMISPVGTDGSVREVLHTLADRDSNPYIRTVSQETLASEPEMQ